MEVIRQNRTIAAILGGLVVVVVLALLFTGGASDSGPSVPVNATTASTTTTRAATPQAAAGVFQSPDVRTLKCNTLLPSDAIKAALGNPSSWGTTALGEDCRIATDESNATLQIAPGSPADFEPGFTIFGVPGVPIEGVGDLALWFGGPTANGDGSVGAIVVAAESELGALVFRIAVGRPDLDSAAQLEIAKDLARAALPRFPGVRLATEAEPKPVPVVVNIEPAPVDLSNLSYVDNLLVREADGDWTRAEGLIATLQFLASEREASDVLRGGPVVDSFSSGIVSIAQEHLAGTPDIADATEIDRLLRIVAPQPVAPPADLLASASRRELAAINLSQQPDPNCYVAFPDFDETCFLTTEIGAGYRVFRPDIGAGETWAGWTGGGSSVEQGVAGMARVLASLAGEKAEVEVFLTPGTQTAHELEVGRCRVFLGSSLEQLRLLGDEYLEQAVAVEVARCHVGLASSGASRWWADPLALYLSEVAFPTASLEQDILALPNALEAQEQSSGFRNRSQTNLAYFESISAGNPQTAVDAATAMALTGLESVPNIEAQLHQLAQELSDGIFFDEGAGLHPYRPRAYSDVASTGTILTTRFRPFTTQRIDLRVPSGMHACLSYGSVAVGLQTSWRKGAPGASADPTGWSSELPSTLDGRATFVMTSSAIQTFDLIIDRVSEESDCEEQQTDSERGDDSGPTGGRPGGDVDEEGSTIPEPPCGGCPRTSFYSDWEIPRTN